MSRGGARVWGNDHPAAQLTEKRVIRYRNLVRSGKATVGEIAAKEGCSHGRISMAVRGETWQHLNDVAPPVPATPRRPAQKAAPATRTATRTKTTRAKTARTKTARTTTVRTKTARAKGAPVKAARTKTAPAKRVGAKRAAAKKAAPAAKSARAKTARR